MSKLNLKLGQRCAFSFYQKRIKRWDEEKLQTIIQWRPIELLLPMQGIVVGKRTAWNGEIISEPGEIEGTFYNVFIFTTPVAVVLVATDLKRKPVPVALADLILK